MNAKYDSVNSGQRSGQRFPLWTNQKVSAEDRQRTRAKCGSLQSARIAQIAHQRLFVAGDIEYPYDCEEYWFHFESKQADGEEEQPIALLFAGIGESSFGRRDQFIY